MRNEELLVVLMLFIQLTLNMLICDACEFVMFPEAVVHMHSLEIVVFLTIITVEINH